MGTATDPGQLDPSILERVTRGRDPRESMTNDERLQAWAAKLAPKRRVRFNPQMHAHLREVERSNGERNHGQ